MELSLTDLRIIIDVLKNKHRILEQTLAQLDETQEDQRADLGNDLYALEILQGCLQDEYQQHLRQIEQEAYPKVEKEQPIQDGVYAYNMETTVKQPVEMA